MLLITEVLSPDNQAHHPAIAQAACVDGELRIPAPHFNVLAEFCDRAEQNPSGLNPN